jgi:hypothetical protein
VSANWTDLPDAVSHPGLRYFATRLELIEFVAFVGVISQRLDDVQRIAREALLETERDPARRAGLEARAAEDATTREHQRFILLLRETALTRSVDNFLAYLSDLLAEIFKARPETLRSSEQVKVADVLSHESLDAFIESHAEDRVEALAQGGFVKLSRYFDGYLGFDLFHEVESHAVADLIGYRNVYVHNRGIINRTFLSRVSEPERFKLGEYLALNTEEIMADPLDAIVASVDGRAADKWGLPRPFGAQDVETYARRSQANRSEASDQLASDG